MEPFLPVCAEGDGLLRGRKRQVHVAGMQRCRRAAPEAPHKRVRVAQQTSCLDATVEQLARLGQLAAQAPKPSESKNENEEELATLAGRARHRQCASGVSVAVGVPTR